MILYEVNLKIEKEIVEDYLFWLKTHMAELLKLDGFVDARVWEDQDEEIDLKFFTVHYYVENETAMTEYLREYAAKLRQQGRDKFGNRYKAERRIFNAVHFKTN